MARQLQIDPVTRIEGHARVLIDLTDDGRVESARLIVNELRGFERLLVGMEMDRIPLVTARVCGVCPTAHALAAVKALEQGLGVCAPPAARLQRELMYMGHFIHSHAVNLFALAGPDLVFGIDADPQRRNILAMVREQPEFATKALRLRSLGQRINETIGGRGVHPVTAVIGGISSRLGEKSRAEIEAAAREALELCRELLKWAKTLLAARFNAHPDLLKGLRLPTSYMGTHQGGKLNFLQGRLRVIDPEGAELAEFEGTEYDRYLAEYANDHSYLKGAFFQPGQAERRVFRVGSLARLNCAEALETPEAQAEFELFRKQFGRPCHLTVLQLYARLIELLYSCEKALELSCHRQILGEYRVEVKLRPGRCTAHVEAPRGSLFHDYEIDERGIVRKANLLVATQQNYEAINLSLKQAAEAFVVGRDDEGMLNALEFAIRTYDPCLSCATHALGRMPMEVSLRRPGEPPRILGRGR